MAINLRIPTADDVPALAEVHLAAWLDTYCGICDPVWMDSLNVQTFEGYHRPRLTPASQGGVVPDPREPFFVAEEGRQIIGFARGGPTRATSPMGDPLPEGFAREYSAELYAIYVRPDEQGKGVGRLLFARIIESLRQLDHTSMCLWMLSGNKKAQRFYERAGGMRLPDRAPITLAGRAYEQTAYAWRSLP